MEFRPMPKMPRLSRPFMITEKIDGTNASVFIWDPTDPKNEELGIGSWPDGRHTSEPVQKVGPYFILAGSRNRWISPKDDNYGFASWVQEHAEELVKLGPGHHFGEWWGSGINRGYDVPDKRFSLFNVSRWFKHGVPHVPTSAIADPAKLQVAPVCCSVVPVLYAGEEFHTSVAHQVLGELAHSGSVAAPGFMRPEGIVIYHEASGTLFKKTIVGDERGKSAEGHVKKERPPRPPKDPSKGGRRIAQDPAYAGPWRRKTDKEICA